MTECDWAGCTEHTAGAMRFCREHGHAILCGAEFVPATCENIARAERIIGGLQDWLDGRVRDWPDMKVPTKFPRGRENDR